jgi:hypothetical protein
MSWFNRKKQQQLDNIEDHHEKQDEELAEIKQTVNLTEQRLQNIQKELERKLTEGAR